MNIKEHYELLKKHNDILKAKKRYYAKRKLLNFTRYSMSNYIVNWHHEIICKYLDMWIAKKIKRLIILSPPRHGKSELVSRHLPSFILGNNPDAEIIACSYSADLAKKMNTSVQRIITSNNYKKLFPDTQLTNLTGKQKTATTYKRTVNEFEIVNRNGTYRSCGVDGGISGMGADYVIIDDPIKNAVEAYSTTHKQHIWDWYASTLYTRLEGNASILLTMTRWYDDDLAGRLIKQAEEHEEADQWVVLNFPAVYDPGLKWLVNEDTRKHGEALWPYKYNDKRLKSIKALQKRWWHAMYQGNPTSGNHEIINLDWFIEFDKIPDHKDWVQVIQFWDTASKPSELTNCPWVCGTWIITENAYYLIDVFREWMNYPDGKKAAIALADKYKPYCIVIEDKSTGQSLIQEMKLNTLYTILEFLPENDKVTRFSVESPAIEAGLVHVPRTAGWRADFDRELETFPGATMDQADMISMALRWFRENTVKTDMEALKEFYEQSVPSYIDNEYEEILR